uniref:Peptidase S1 domain-containing protein n=1 Tax=Timema poppense TaxID=170557 RepID=A0A7R9DTE1_TIMPO|nr:unnamed protein product [Timema poppensis]
MKSERINEAGKFTAMKVLNNGEATGVYGTTCEMLKEEEGPGGGVGEVYKTTSGRSQRWRSGTVLTRDGVMRTETLISVVLNNEPGNGDSGGPLQVLTEESSDVYSVVGITSFGPATCGGGPAVLH